MKLTNKFSKTESNAHDLLSIDDLLKEIILRLPIKSMVHMKLVCKNWNSLISDLNINSPVGLLFPYSGSWYTYVPFHVNDKSRDRPFVRVFNFIKDTSGIRILQSCNGLLLCCSDQPSKYGHKYYVCNPTTKEYSMLPRYKFWWLICGMNLAFDPSKSSYYKVVYVREFEWYRYELKYQLEIYSSEPGGGTWRKCGETFVAAQVNFKNGVYWNGAIHWISTTATGKSIYFNPGDDQLMMPKVMPTPPILDGDCSTRNYYFGESRGHLHYIDVYRMVTGFNVYEMKIDYSEWFCKYRLDLSRIVGSNLFSICTVVWVKKEKDSFLVLQVNRENLIQYNLVCGTFETICDVEVDMVEFDFDSSTEFPLQYIESLSRI
ncbi:hypothetical protein DH2020_049186 [Rehmannia glutinosa]|uniref:F-box protein n=1 Tax=Rehmannia glutinosa TaxID=99300 RepID=A0ABR0U3G8_REHGL